MDSSDCLLDCTGNIQSGADCPQRKEDACDNEDQPLLLSHYVSVEPASTIDDKLVADVPSPSDTRHLETANASHVDGNFQIRQGDYSGYNFRPLVRSLAPRSAFVTLLDKDDSGTYDPNAPFLKPIRPEAKPNRKDDESAIDYQARLRANKLGLAASRVNGGSLVVTFRTSSAQLRELTNRITDQWAPLHWNVLSNPAVDSEDSAKSYPSRKRLEGNTAGESVSTVKVSITDPAGLEQDLFGHPAARGCVACRKLAHQDDDMKCPLLDGNSTWPCNFCVEDGVDCEMIIPPGLKDTCESCKKKKLPCSYRVGKSDSSVPCRECQDAGAICFAGPAEDAYKERISYDKDYSKKPDRRYVQCTGCRKLRKGCSLKSKADEPPCKRCTQQGLTCDFEQIPRVKRAPAKAKSIVEPTKFEPVASQTLTSVQKTRYPANAITVYTSLCHPVTFMHEATSECHWCDRASYGPLGLGWRDVVVVLSDDQTRYKELENGHSNDLKANVPSKMCTTCTMKRTRIIGCDDHEIRPVEVILLRIKQRAQIERPRADIEEENLEIDSSVIDADGMFQRLLSNTARPSDQWCSLCPSPAIYRCCTPQDTDMWGEPVSSVSAEASGCGLLLCEDCEQAFDGLGDVEAVLDMIVEDREQEVWQLGLRADAELLKREGLLIRSVL